MKRQMVPFKSNHPPLDSTCCPRNRKLKTLFFWLFYYFIKADWMMIYWNIYIYMLPYFCNNWSFSCFSHKVQVFFARQKGIYNVLLIGAAFSSYGKRFFCLYQASSSTSDWKFLDYILLNFRLLPQESL